MPYQSKKGGTNGKGRNEKRLAITDGDDSEGSMPSLQTVSDSSEDEEDLSSDEEDGEGEEEEDSDEEYDEEAEDQLREMLREAMDIAAADPDFYDPRREANDFKEMAEDKKGNPFLKLLGSLRGR